MAWIIRIEWCQKYSALELLPRCSISGDKSEHHTTYKTTHISIHRIHGNLPATHNHIDHSKEPTRLSHIFRSTSLRCFNRLEIINFLKSILQYRLAFHQLQMISNLRILFREFCDFVFCERMHQPAIELAWKLPCQKRDNEEIETW